MWRLWLVQCLSVTHRLHLSRPAHVLDYHLAQVDIVYIYKCTLWNVVWNIYHLSLENSRNGVEKIYPKRSKTLKKWGQTLFPTKNIFVSKHLWPAREVAFDKILFDNTLKKNMLNWRGSFKITILTATKCSKYVSNVNYVNFFIFIYRSSRKIMKPWEKSGGKMVNFVRQNEWKASRCSHTDT